MLSDFSWDMTGYIPKHAVNPHGDGIIPYAAERIFQLEPEPPAVGNLNEYILSALQEKNLIYFSFFLHHYEPQLNKRIKDFLGVDGGDLYDTDRFIDIKLSCREQMLQKLMDYDLTKGAEYATYIYPFIRDAMLRFRMGEEKWSVYSSIAAAWRDAGAGRRGHGFLFHYGQGSNRLYCNRYLYAGGLLGL